ncbi:Ankyrin repeat domain-containing protein 42 [Chytriomyces hyalinus]|nr:Ankyrin repeat domain-containing protein 42 [Chytriomyces hyalinus]
MKGRSTAKEREREKDRDKDAAKDKDRDTDNVSIASASSGASFASVSSSASTGSALGSLSFLNIRKRMSKSQTPSIQSNNTSNSAGSTAIKGLFSKQLSVATSASSSVNSQTASPTSAAKRFANSPTPPVFTAGSGSGFARSLSFAEFRLADTRQQRQRRCLYALQKLEARCKADGVSLGVSSAAAPGSVKKPYKEPKFKDDKRLGLGKLSNLLQKKRRRRSRTEVFHLINLAITDQSIPYALNLLDDLSSGALRKKFPLHANRAFYSAMGQGFEPICIAMFEKGFPLSVNSPIIIKASTNLWKYVPRETPTGKVVSKFKRISTTTAPDRNGGGRNSSMAVGGKNSSGDAKAGGALGAGDTMPSIQLPSYFMSAVSLGLDNVVRAMVKRADVNQNWHGLTPLHIAASKNLVGITQFLLDNGADPTIGILVSQYALLRKLKSISSYPDIRTSMPIVGNSQSQSQTPTVDTPNAGPAVFILQPSRPVSMIDSNMMASFPREPNNLGIDATVMSPSHALTSPLAASLPLPATKDDTSSPKTTSSTLPLKPQLRNPSPSSSNRSASALDRSRASSLSAAAGVSFVGPSSSIKRNLISSGGSIKSNAQASINRPINARLTGCIFFSQPGCEGEKGLTSVSNEDGKRRSSVFHMWQTDFMKDKVIYPVELAAACGNYDLARLLLTRMDSKLLAKSSFGLLVQRDVDLSLLFIRTGVPTTQQDAYGSNSLHLACRAGDLELVTAYIESGKFDINSKGQNEWTPLHEAVGLRRYEVSRFLVKAGASMDVVNKLGETPRALGIKLGIPKLELDEAFLATSPTTASSFQESNTTGSPDTNSLPASPTKTAPPEKSGSLGRLNLLDKIKQKLPVESKNMGSVPSLATTALTSKAAAALVAAAAASNASGNELRPANSNNDVTP